MKSRGAAEARANERRAAVDSRQKESEEYKGEFERREWREEGAYISSALDEGGPVEFGKYVQDKDGFERRRHFLHLLRSDDQGKVT